MHEGRHVSGGPRAIGGTHRTHLSGDTGRRLSQFAPISKHACGVALTICALAEISSLADGALLRDMHQAWLSWGFGARRGGSKCTADCASDLGLRLPSKRDAIDAPRATLS